MLKSWVALVIENESSMSEILRSGPAELRKALGMNFVLGVQTRVAVLTAILISGAVPVARAGVLPGIISNGRSTFQTVGLHSSALSPQDSQASPQSAPDAHARPPAVDSGHAGSTPIVAYEHGQLTIIAENARLSEVMSALHRVMGTEIDLPAGASNDRVWARLGPGPARRVLSDLLSNTDLDYVIQASSSDAGGIQSVTLTARVDSGKAGASSEPAGRMDGRRQAQANSVPTEAPDTEAPASQEPAVAAVTPEATTPSSSAAAVDPQPVAAAVEPQSVAAAVQSQVADSIAHPGPPASLTQEQMAQQLMNMYQQRKQLQQNQIGSTPN
jgi:hypothetical protein